MAWFCARGDQFSPSSVLQVEGKHVVEVLAVLHIVVEAAKDDDQLPEVKCSSKEITSFVESLH